MRDLPIGTMTFLFTNIASSTNLWERDPMAMRAAGARHDALVEAYAEQHGDILVHPLVRGAAVRASPAQLGRRV